eukprot:g92.t1
MHRRHVEEAKLEMERQKANIADRLRRERAAVRQLAAREAQLKQRRKMSAVEGKSAEKLSKLALIKAKLLSAKLDEMPSSASEALRKVKKQMEKRAGGRFGILQAQLKRQVIEDNERFARLEKELEETIAKEIAEVEEDNAIKLQALKEATSVRKAALEEQAKKFTKQIEVWNEEMKPLRVSSSTADINQLQKLQKNRDDLESKIKYVTEELATLQTEHMSSLETRVEEKKEAYAKLEERHAQMRANFEKERAAAMEKYEAKKSKLADHIQDMSEEQLKQVAEAQKIKSLKMIAFQKEMDHEAALLQQEKKEMEKKIEDLEKLIGEKQRVIEQGERKKRVMARRERERRAKLQKKKNANAIRAVQSRELADRNSLLDELKSEHMRKLKVFNEKEKKRLDENQIAIQNRHDEDIKSLKELNKGETIEIELKNLENQLEEEKEECTKEYETRLKRGQELFDRKLITGEDQLVDNPSYIADPKGESIAILVHGATDLPDMPPERNGTALVFAATRANNGFLKDGKKGPVTWKDWIEMTSEFSEEKCWAKTSNAPRVEGRSSDWKCSNRLILKIGAGTEPPQLVYGATDVEKDGSLTIIGGGICSIANMGCNDHNKMGPLKAKPLSMSMNFSNDDDEKLEGKLWITWKRVTARQHKPKVDGNWVLVHLEHLEDSNNVLTDTNLSIKLFVDEVRENMVEEKHEKVGTKVEGKNQEDDNDDKRKKLKDEEEEKEDREKKVEKKENEGEGMDEEKDEDNETKVKKSKGKKDVEKEDEKKQNKAEGMDEEKDKDNEIKVEKSKEKKDVEKEDEKKQNEAGEKESKASIAVEEKEVVEENKGNEENKEEKEENKEKESGEKENEKNKEEKEENKEKEDKKDDDEEDKVKDKKDDDEEVKVEDKKGDKEIEEVEEKNEDTMALSNIDFRNKFKKIGKRKYWIQSCIAFSTEEKVLGLNNLWYWREKCLLYIGDYSSPCLNFGLHQHGDTWRDDPNLISCASLILKGAKSNNIINCDLKSSDNEKALGNLFLSWTRVEVDDPPEEDLLLDKDDEIDEFHVMEFQDQIKSCRGIVVSIKEGVNLILHPEKNEKKVKNEMVGNFYVSCRLGKLGDSWEEKSLQGWKMQSTRKINHSHPRFRERLWLPIEGGDPETTAHFKELLGTPEEEFSDAGLGQGEQERAALHICLWHSPPLVEEGKAAWKNDIMIGQVELVLDPVGSCLPGAKLHHIPVGGQPKLITAGSAIAVSWWLGRSKDEETPVQLIDAMTDFDPDVSDARAGKKNAEEILSDEKDENEDLDSKLHVDDVLVYCDGRRLPQDAAGEGGILPPEAVRAVAGGGIKSGHWMKLTVHGCTGIPEASWRGSKGVYVMLVAVDKRASKLLNFQEKYDSALAARKYTTKLSTDLYSPKFEQTFYFRNVFKNETRGSRGRDEILELHACVMDKDPGGDELVGEKKVELKYKRSYGDEPMELVLENNARRGSVGMLNISWTSVQALNIPWVQVSLNMISSVDIKANEFLYIKMIVGEKGSSQQPHSLQPIRKFHQLWKIAQSDRKHVWRIEKDLDKKNDMILVERSFWFRINSHPDRFNFDTLLEPELRIAYFKGTKRKLQEFEISDEEDEKLGEATVSLTPNEILSNRFFRVPLSISRSKETTEETGTAILCWKTRDHPHTKIKSWEKVDTEIYGRLNSLQSMIIQSDLKKSILDLPPSDSDEDNLSEGEYEERSKNWLKKRKQDLIRSRLSQFPEPKPSKKDVFPAGYRKSLSASKEEKETKLGIESITNDWLKFTIRCASKLPATTWRGDSRIYVEALVVTESLINQFKPRFSFADKKRLAEKVETRCFKTKEVEDMHSPDFEQSFYCRAVFPRGDGENILRSFTDASHKLPQVHLAVLDEEPGGDEIVGETMIELSNKRSIGDVDVPLPLRYNSGMGNIQVTWRSVPATQFPWLKVNLVGASGIGGELYKMPLDCRVALYMVVSEKGSDQTPPSLEPMRRFHQKWKLARSDRRVKWLPSKGYKTSRIRCEKIFWFRINDPPDMLAFPTLLKPELHVAFFAEEWDSSASEHAKKKQEFQLRNSLLGEIVIPLVVPGESSASNGVENFPLGRGNSSFEADSSTGQGDVQLEWEQCEHPQMALRRWEKRKRLIELDADLQATAEQHKRRTLRFQRRAKRMKESKEVEERLVNALKVASKKEESLKAEMEKASANLKVALNSAEQASQLSQEAEKIVSPMRFIELQKDSEAKRADAETRRKDLAQIRGEFDEAKAKKIAAQQMYNEYIQKQMNQMQEQLKLKKTREKSKRSLENDENGESTDSDEHESCSSDDDVTRHIKRTKRAQRLTMKKHGYHKPSDDTLTKHETRAKAMERFGYLFDISTRRREMLSAYSKGGHSHLSLQEFESAFNSERRWKRKVDRRFVRNNKAATKIQSAYRGSASRSMKEEYITKIVAAREKRIKKKEKQREVRLQLKKAEIQLRAKQQAEEEAGGAEIWNSLEVEDKIVLAKSIETRLQERDAVKQIEGVFLQRKKEIKAKLEEERRAAKWKAALEDNEMVEAATTIETAQRMRQGKALYQKKRACAIQIQSVERASSEKKRYNKKRACAIQIQSVERASSEKKRYNKKRACAVQIQSAERARSEKKRYDKKRRSAIQIQSAERASSEKKKYDKKRRSASKIQRFQRKNQERKQFFLEENDNRDKDKEDKFKDTEDKGNERKEKEDTEDEETDTEDDLSDYTSDDDI